MAYKFILFFRFYSQNSSFLHGGPDLGDEETDTVYGQQAIHQKIMQLNLRDTHVKIRQVTVFNQLLKTHDHNNGYLTLNRLTVTPHWSLV